jgi:hypothetical protein
MILNTFLLSNSFDHISFKLQLLKMLKKNKDNEYIKEKIMWIINYFHKWFIYSEARVSEYPQIVQKRN